MNKSAAEYSRSPSYLIWKRFKKNKGAITGLALIIFCSFLALFRYYIMPDSTPMANEMILQLSTQKPGFSTKVLLIRKNKEVAQAGFFQHLFGGQESIYASPVPISDYRFEKDKLIYEEYNSTSGNNKYKAEPQKVSLAEIVYSLSPDNPDIRCTEDSLFFKNYKGTEVHRSIQDMRQEVEQEHIPVKTFYFGTDRFGRDMLSRLIAGTWVSLSVGFISVFISVIIGITLGAIAGFYRGKTDNFIMWIINVIWSIPTLLLVIAITLALGKGFEQVFIAVGLTMWVELARVVRGQIMSIREMEFVEAGKALGFNNTRIIIKHILPNIVGPIVVISAANFASAILLEAGLSFLGIGAQPPMPSWGVMIKENYGYIIVDAAYMAILPGAAIMLLVLALNLVGNGLRDAFDSKQFLSAK